MIKSNSGNKDVAKLSIISKILIVYFSGVLLLGLSYVYSSKGGNLATVIAFVNGNRDLATEALIYSSILELLFDIFAILGSIFCIILITNFRTRVLSMMLIHALTILFYITSRVALFQGIIHISTQGMIKNTEMWDFKMISSELFGANNITAKLIFLVIGFGLVLIFRNVNELTHKNTSPNTTVSDIPM